MTPLALKPRDQRLLAVALLLLVAALAYVLMLHWWFVAPMRQISADMRDLRDTQSRYAAAIAQKGALQQRISALGAGQAASSAFLPSGSAEPERRLVGIEDRFHLGPVVGLHFPQAHDLAHDLAVVADRLGLCVDVADIVGDALLFFLEAFDALDQEAQAVVGRFGHVEVLR